MQFQSSWLVQALALLLFELFWKSEKQLERGGKTGFFSETEAKKLTIYMGMNGNLIERAGFSINLILHGPEIRTKKSMCSIK